MSYQPNRDSLYYASAAKGFRPGGVNPYLPSVCTAQLPAPIPSAFSADSLWQYEIGSKNTLLDNRLQVNASIYYVQWKSIQQTVFLPCGFGFVSNLGKVVSKGGDIAVQFRATPDLTLGLTAAYTDAAFTGTVPLSGIGESVNLVSAGDHLPAAPWGLMADLEYVFNSVREHPYFRLDYQLATAQRSLTQVIDPANHPSSDPTLPGLPETRFLTVRGGIRMSGFDVSLFVQNALNFYSPTFVVRDVATTELNGYPENSDTNYYGRGFAPRTFGVTATYRY